jgi:hypothetical protein
MLICRVRTVIRYIICAHVIIFCDTHSILKQARLQTLDLRHKPFNLDQIILFSSAESNTHKIYRTR